MPETECDEIVTRHPFSPADPQSTLARTVGGRRLPCVPPIPIEPPKSLMKSMITNLFAVAMLAATVQGQTLSIKGSDTLGAKLVPQLAEAFKAAGNTQVKFEIAAEGSSTAFPAIANATAQLGMSSREVKSDERTFCRTKGITLVEHLRS